MSTMQTLDPIPRGPGKARKSSSHDVLQTLKKYKFLYGMLLIPLIYYLVFCYGPMYGVLIAFEKFSIVKGVWGSKWVGLMYFKQYLTDPYFWKLVRNTLLLSIYGTLWGFPAPIILALLINEIRHSWFKRLTQTISYLPHFISTVVVCGMVIGFLANDGPINNFLSAIGLQRVPFMMLPSAFRTVYITSGIWQGIGWSSIIYLAAISGVDVQLYEAAIMDGAGRFKQALYVTLPAIIPVIVIMFILNIGSLMSVSLEKLLMLYNGSTYEVSDTVATYVYRRGIEGADFSYSTAVGVFQSVINMIFLFCANFISRRVSDNSLW